MLLPTKSRWWILGVALALCGGIVVRADSIRQGWLVTGGSVSVSADFGRLTVPVENSTLELVSLDGMFRAFTAGSAGQAGYSVVAGPLGDLQLQTPQGVFELQSADTLFDANAGTVQIQAVLVAPGGDGQAVGDIVIQLTVAPARFEVAPPIGGDGPETPCMGATGPDVIVGDLNGVANYASSATTGLDALSLGTTSCNLGTVWLNWISSTNQHPVIGGALYKLSRVNGADRFEQIGQSWLKHGFYALSGTLCCTNCSATDGTHLGVGCSDPYTASRNGSQSNLGPKSQVNASTGAYPYPPANPPFSGTTARRCEVRLADLAPSSATVRYFGEGHYVTPDDAAAHNNNNNASYRGVTVTGGPGEFTFALSGSTQRERSAIRAWHDVDPTVTEVEAPVAGDGLFIVSYKVTDLGGGQFHYEYALYNMNSDRSGQSFVIPVPGGITVTNMGFHDVEYRNGDGLSNVNYSSADWAAARSGGNVTWSTETYATNQNANAVRWGTTYNFRFDANAAPGSANATLGFFRPGAPENMTIAVQGPSVLSLPTIVSANPPVQNPFVPGLPFRDVLQPGAGAAVNSGIGAAGTPAQGDYTYTPISVTFNTAITPAPTPATVTVACTDSAGNGAADCPTVASVVAGPNANQYLLTLSAAIPPLECTTITFAGSAPGQRLQYQSLPGDANMNGMSSGQDVVALVFALNDGTSSVPNNGVLYDVNRNGTVTGIDVIRLVQLLNGTNTTQVFNAATVAACP